VAPPRIAFIGAGNMAGSIIGGLLNRGLPAEHIAVSDPVEAALAALAPRGVRLAPDNAAAVAGADVVVLAVKPQVMAAVAGELAPALATAAPVVVSIAAGIDCASLQQWLGPDVPVVRCMPNTPALVGAGMAALYAGPGTEDSQRALAEQVMAPTGELLWVEEEALLDAVTAVSGSGPAYFFLVMEAMQAAGEQLGLSPAQARRLVGQTALGAAQMAVGERVEAAELRRRVTSPGGTTEQAIHCLEQGGLRSLFHRALVAARDRSAELTREFGATRSTTKAEEAADHGRIR